MTRQRYTFATSLLLAVVAMLGGQAVSASAEKRPNILFFLTDDQPQVGLGCMGNRHIRTPNMDALAAKGT